MTVSLLEILSAARAHAAPLAAESAGYLLLAAADHVALAPRRVTGDDVELAADGAVRLRATRAPSAESAESAELGLRALLGHALEVSSSVGPALRRAAARREPAGLPHLVRELEAALIPVNRAAARRALSRLYRETERARGSGKLVVAALPVPAPPSAARDVTETAPEQESAPDAAEVVLQMTESPATPAPALALPDVATAPPPPALLPLLELPELTPEPQRAEADADMTKPEPVVERARKRGISTPALGTVVTAQTLPGEEAELTERAPAVELDDDDLVDEDLLAIEVEVDAEPVVAEPVVAEPVVAEPVVAERVEQAAEAPQPWEDPEPSVMPDVLTAMVTLHTGFDADEQPTRLRGVLTAVSADPLADAVTPLVAQSVSDREPLGRDAADALSHEDEEELGEQEPFGDEKQEELVPEIQLAAAGPLSPILEPLWLTEPEPDPVVEAAPIAEPPYLNEGELVSEPAPLSDLPPVKESEIMVEGSLVPEPPAVSPLEPGDDERPEAIVEAAPDYEPAPLFISELADPVVHEALTWNPGPVRGRLSPLPPALCIAEPAPEPSPYAPAVLPARSRDVSELLDSFHVSSAVEERELRGALKEMAGLELTPMPHPLVEEG